MTITPLDTRRKKILHTVVEAYIQTGAPISSQAIAQRFRWRISAATIRNVLAELDNAGLIWQPHTSAGRIPTDLGYRYYINSLLAVELLTQGERELIESRSLSRSDLFDDLLKEMLRILSNFTGYTAMAFSSGLTRILFKRLELVSVHSTKLLVVLVSSEGVVETTVIELPYKIEQGQLSKISKFLNHEFSGMALDEIKQRISQRLLSTTNALFSLIKATAEILDLALVSFDRDRLYLEGASYTLAQPEFQDARKLGAILRTFEQEEPLLAIMREDLESEGVKVHIGQENACADIQECSLVISNFKNKGANMGALGIIGPRRMSYSRVISTVRYMARILSEKIARS